ncbi:MAG TPA: SUMF1/EgtB/PvdO family nonheme iron enzyme [Candidatus Methylomirabilis sp.]|jgi:formylglycine-generating enzyme required for sulfatase activity|nr:SUMF1/EgtB/PvdO family nonheme iron enzyme [Candidatus Methylomirabilis sp.]
MVLIPAGPFIMGSDAAERSWAYGASSPVARQARWYDDEPRRILSLPAFWIDRFLVTHAEYLAFVRATGHRVPGIGKEEYVAQGFLVHDYDREVTRFLWQGGEPPPGLGEHPVVLVSVEDAEAYCRWRATREGRLLRLPTEEEWEKAARGADGRWFPWGKTWDPRRLNNAEAGPLFTTPVTAYPLGRSPYGMFDAAGNVFEWTASRYPDGRRVMKGAGSWDDEAGICRPASRHGRPPSSRHILFGFRCAGPAVEPGS